MTFPPRNSFNFEREANQLEKKDEPDNSLMQPKQKQNIEVPSNSEKQRNEAVVNNFFLFVFENTKNYSIK